MKTPSNPPATVDYFHEKEARLFAALDHVGFLLDQDNNTVTDPAQPQQFFLLSDLHARICARMKANQNHYQTWFAARFEFMF